MRQDFIADWVFAVRHSLEDVVTQNFPRDIHIWPLVRTFNYEAHVWKNTHMILVLRDKASGMPAGPSKPAVLQDCKSPKEPPSTQNLAVWQEYLSEKFALRRQDAAVVIPFHDSGTGVKEDLKLWSGNDKELWQHQIGAIISRHFYYLKGVDISGDFYLPPGYEFLAEECAKFFEDHPNYEKNIFIMARLAPGNRLLEQLDEGIRDVLKSRGLDPVRADDKMYMRDRNLWNNVCVHMLCSAQGLAVLEDRVKDEFNPNIALEYGFMRALNKPTLLLADSGFRNLRADIIGTLREEFDIVDIEGTIRQPIEKWLTELGLL